jgi:hypothetical protein
MGCYSLPPLKEISSRDLWEGEAQENDEGCLGRGVQRMSEMAEKRIFLVSHAVFPSGVGDRACCIVRPCCVHHLTLSAWQLHQILWVEKNCLNFQCWGWHLLLEQELPTKAIISAIRGDLLLDRLNRMDTWRHEWDQNDSAWSESTRSRVLDRLGQYKNTIKERRL